MTNIADTQFTAEAEARGGQFNLLTTRRFAPFFWTQFLGAFNDNIFKNMLLMLVAFNLGRYIVDGSVEQITQITQAANFIFILPFFLFSAIAGQLADKFEKSSLIRKIKLGEIVIMCFAALAFQLEGSAGLIALMLVLFAMGTQSTFFGPIKYSLIPQAVKREELVSGNALVESGTFLAILIGTMVGAELFLRDKTLTLVSIVVVTIAAIGYITSRSIPKAPASLPDLPIKLNPIRQTMAMIKVTQRSHPVFLSVMAISWYWFMGAAIVSQIPVFTSQLLGGDESIVQVIFALFSVGMAVGSILCSKFSSGQVELGLVPIGALGLSIFAGDLVFAYQTNSTGVALDLSAFLAAGNYRLLFDIAMLGVAGGFFTVPLYSYVQEKTEPEYRARVIAGLNIFNSLFMLVSALVVVLLTQLGLNVAQIFLVLAIANIVVAAYIFTVVPEFVLRLVVWLLSRVLYRIKGSNLDAIPLHGAAVIVANHVTFVDWLLLAASSPRPIRFVMEKAIFEIPVGNWLCRAGKAIPIVSKRKDPEGYERAFADIASALDDDRLVCIFPEGMLTLDGELNEFRPGIEKILQANPVPVVPIALKGLWGSFFSRKPHWRPKRFWSRVQVVVGKTLSPAEAKAKYLQQSVSELRGSVC